MMIIENGNIYITRGDDAVVTVGIEMGGEAYAIQGGDVLTLTVRELPEASSNVLLQASSLPGSAEIPLPHIYTEAVPAGQYSADIQLNTQDGQIITIWPEMDPDKRHRVRNIKNFVVMPEVTV